MEVPADSGEGAYISLSLNVHDALAKKKRQVGGDEDKLQSASSIWNN